MEKGQEQEDSDTFGRWPGSWQLNGSGRPLTDPLQGVGVSLAGQCHIYCPLFSVNLLFFSEEVATTCGSNATGIAPGDATILGCFRVWIQLTRCLVFELPSRVLLPLVPQLCSTV